MAVAGMQNVSVFSPSFFGEPRSPVSRGWRDEQVRPTTRASSLLQMWRELEERNDLGTECLSRSTSMGHGSENGDEISEGSDEIENQGVTGSETEYYDKSRILSEQSSDLGEIERERVRQTFREWMNSGGKGHSANRFCNGPQWLGENERGRVRIIREWVQMNTQQRSNCESPRDVVAEVDSQIEQVRDGLEISNHRTGERRTIRRLCGRQTLVDLLLRSQSERKRELAGLSECKPVSYFAHRNRIQALLRGRFLRNERSIPNERPSSRAETELGLLTQRHTVSDLREGFISKLDKSASTAVNNNEFNFSSSDEMSESDPTPRETDVTENRTSSDMESAVDGSGGQEEFVVHVSDVHDPALGIDQVLSERCRNEPVLDFEVSEQEVLNNVDHLSTRNGEQLSTNITPDSLSETGGIVYGGGILEVFHEHYDPRSDTSYSNETAGPANELERNASEEYIWLNTSTEVEVFNWGNSTAQDVMVEPQEQWPARDFQEAINSWLEMPSEEVGSSVGRNNTSYFPDNDDDTVRNVELRQLFSRRRVSSLLGSSFRHSLDQVLQSHAERLGQATDDWELENTSTPALVEQDQEPLNGDEVAPEPGWDEDFQRSNRPQNYLNHQFGTATDLIRQNMSSKSLQEREVINDLRIDMSMLQQRMNNMQSMLEACVEMQVELQRAVRQEVSAALNRPIFPRDMSEGSTRHDESNWDQIRKGICCLCSDSKIDSLLYRCGHMCTCSKCAENLVQLAGKCPMCHAPVVEMVRAYFVQ